jgi:hypothetical protein
MTNFPNVISGTRVKEKYVKLILKDEIIIFGLSFQKMHQEKFDI